MLVNRRRRYTCDLHGSHAGRERNGCGLAPMGTRWRSSWPCSYSVKQALFDPRANVARTAGCEVSRCEGDGIEASSANVGSEP